MKMKLIIQSKSSSINLGNRRIKEKANENRYFMWSMIIILIGLYLDHIRKKKEKTRRVSIRHLTARLRSTISNWCRRLQAAYACRFIHTQ